MALQEKVSEEEPWGHDMCDEFSVSLATSLTEQLSRTARSLSEGALPQWAEGWVVVCACLGGGGL